MAKDLKIQLDGGAYNAMGSTATFGAATSGPGFTASPRQIPPWLPRPTWAPGTAGSPSWKSPSGEKKPWPLRTGIDFFLAQTGLFPQNQAQH